MVFLPATSCVLSSAGAPRLASGVNLMPFFSDVCAFCSSGPFSAVFFLRILPELDPFSQFPGICASRCHRSYPTPFWRNVSTTFCFFFFRESFSRRRRSSPLRRLRWYQLSPQSLKPSTFRLFLMTGVAFDFPRLASRASAAISFAAPPSVRKSSTRSASSSYPPIVICTHTYYRCFLSPPVASWRFVFSG